MYFYKTIIFDFDGTLFKTDSVFVEAFREVCSAREIPFQSEKDIVKFIGEPMTDICRHFFGQDISNDEVDCISSEVRNIENEIIPKLGKLYDGIEDTLEKLRADGYKLCICSNGSRQYLDNILDTFRIKDKFSLVKSRIEGITKSQLIKQILDDNKCCSAIVVGDTYIDFEAADAAGCLSIGVSYGYGDYAKADFIAHSTSDIYYIIKKINNVLKDVAQQLIMKKEKSKPLFVGINGVDTSGKTTFTNEVSKYLAKLGCKVQVIHMDDFHNPSRIRNIEPDPVISYFNNAFDFETLQKEIFEPVSCEGVLDKELMLLDLQKDRYNNKRRYNIDKDTIILIEGVLLYREPIDRYFDCRIYIDISFDEVINRALQRDSVIFGDSVTERYYSKYIPIQKLYIEKYKPKEKCDIVVNNENFLKPEIKKSSANRPETGKISLEPMENKYIDEVRKMHTDSVAQEMLGIVSLPDLSCYTDENSKCYSILTENNEFAGMVELFNISWKNRRAEFSIAIKPSLRGNGYGYEAVRMMLYIGFYELGLNRIWLRVLEHNNHAISLYEKAGFVKEGICREESLRGGRFINQIQMSILKREWTSNMK